MMGLESLPSWEHVLAETVSAAQGLRDVGAPRTAVRPLWDAHGRVLARAVCTDRDQPPFSRSAMDGYALIAADLVAEETCLRVVGQVPAGEGYEGEVASGEAVAIMTGAPLPMGADAVQIVERCRREGDHVWVQGPLRAGRHVITRGEYGAVGTPVAAQGKVVRDLTLGTLASVGATEVEVYRRPRVTIMATGNELVDIHTVPGPHQIRESNRSMLMGMLAQSGCRVVDGGIVRDELAGLRQSIREGIEDSDVLVLSGGVSVGTFDLVAKALAEEGVELLFHGVRMKPGKPVLLGRHPQGLIFGLPGNPVSSFVTACLFVLPAVRVLGFQPEHGPWRLKVPLQGTLPAPRGRSTFHPGRLTGDGAALEVHALPWAGSGDLHAFAQGNCLIYQPLGAPALSTGAMVEILLNQAVA